jgi:two-component system catabolic regulation response regulator CreB
MKEKKTMDLLSNKNILIIEDEPSITDNIVYSLQSESFSVQTTHLGLQGLDMVSNGHFDLVILDIGLPDISGFEVCKSIRKHSDIPILFLTARGDEIDRVVGFEIGADDYVVKPFSPRELTARVKVILRRGRVDVQSPSKSSPQFLVDESKKQVSCNGTLFDLTAYEYGIFNHLIKHPERIFSREELMQAVWTSPEESFDRAVDTHIKTLRAKLRVIDLADQSIVTHRGMGYSFKADI